MLARMAEAASTGSDAVQPGDQPACFQRREPSLGGPRLGQGAGIGSLFVHGKAAARPIRAHPRMEDGEVMP